MPAGRRRRVWPSSAGRAIGSEGRMRPPCARDERWAMRIARGRVGQRRFVPTVARRAAFPRSVSRLGVSIRMRVRERVVDWAGVRGSVTLHEGGGDGVYPEAIGTTGRHRNRIDGRGLRLRENGALLRCRPDVRLCRVAHIDRFQRTWRKSARHTASFQYVVIGRKYWVRSIDVTLTSLMSLPCSTRSGIESPARRFDHSLR